MAFAASSEIGAKTQELTLGEALAILAIGSSTANDEHGQPLSATAQSYLQALRERAKTLSLPENSAAIFEALPERGCEMEKTFLADNEDFFLACFCAISDTENAGKDCGKLFKHLNDCLQCFEEFSMVMQEYYAKFQELSNRSSGNMTN